MLCVCFVFEEKKTDFLSHFPFYCFDIFFCGGRTIHLGERPASETDHLFIDAIN